MTRLYIVINKGIIAEREYPSNVVNKIYDILKSKYASFGPYLHRPNDDETYIIMENNDVVKVKQATSDIVASLKNLDGVYKSKEPDTLDHVATLAKKFAPGMSGVIDKVVGLFR